jgi:hypothetical protein
LCDDCCDDDCCDDSLRRSTAVSPTFALTGSDLLFGFPRLASFGTLSDGPTAKSGGYDDARVQERIEEARARIRAALRAISYRKSPDYLGADRLTTN